MQIGDFVLHPDMHGVARVADEDGVSIRLESFESVARPVAYERWVPRASVIRHVLSEQTRVFHRDEWGTWRAARVISGGPGEYVVRFPNAVADTLIPTIQLRVRWNRPLEDPLQVLVAGAQESPFFRDARLPVIHDLIEQRAACASVPAVLSARVQLHEHQVNAAARVLSDPVQRYLLADEVGLGKTIEAGFVIRQTFLDDPKSKVAIIAPDALRTQWTDELRLRFFLDDFISPGRPGSLTITKHETPDRWRRLVDFDLVVVDEAHRLVGADLEDEVYSALRAVCHSVPKLLLLSATPVLQREETHLGLLHLLDPDLYRWKDIDLFRSRLGVRRELARIMSGLDPRLPFLLPDVLDQVRSLLPDDPRFEVLATGVRELSEDDSACETAISEAVEAVRGHVGETYRLHRRVIRHRREAVLGAALDDDGYLPPFEVTGRTRPKLLTLTSAEHEAASDALHEWQTRVRDALLDAGADHLPYGPVLALLAARTCGPADDLLAALNWRLYGDRDAADVAGLSAAERTLLASVPVLPAEAAVGAALAALPGHDGLDEIVGRLGRGAGPRTVVFAGPGSLAGRVARALHAANYAGAIHPHLSGRDAAELEQAVQGWRRRGGVLVCDGSGDDGLNLQAAEIAIHLRLPTNPNRLEQRIGRVDRYGSGPPATQLAFGDQGTSTLTASWRSLLVSGYRIFDRSVSALQDVVARDLGGIWAAGVHAGADGLLGAGDGLRQTLGEELRGVNQLDMLEASEEAGRATRSLALDVARYELRDRGARDPLLRLLGGDEGFRMNVQVGEQGRVSVDSSSRTLLGAQLSRRLDDVPKVSRSGHMARESALRHGGRLFRIGNPLVDAVADVLQIDDRGRASAHWRTDPEFEGDPLPYFSFVYLVETDDGLAKEVMAGRDGDLRALRRRADSALPPFVRTVWIPANSDRAIEDPALLAWLGAPYRNDADDVNLSRDRVGPLYALFGGEAGFIEGATTAQDAARAELRRVTDLQALCAAAGAVLQNEGAVLAAQARARALAGRLLDDDESLLLDQALNDALIVGTLAPRICLQAVTCLVRSSRAWSTYDG